VRLIALAAAALALAPMAPAYAQARQAESTAQRHAVDVERIVSPGGIEAWLVSDSTVPMIVMRAFWRGGSAIEPENAIGVTSVMTDMLTEGAAR
jgi:predicted Zn-dependent peptidase